MINVDLAYKITNRLLNDNQITDRYPIADWERYAKLAQLEIVRRLRKAFEAGTTNNDNIAELKVKKQFNLTNGVLTKPSDYLYFSAPLTRVWYKDGQGIQRTSQRPVDLVTDNELGDRLNSQFDAPSYEYPIVTNYQNFLQFYPLDLTQAELMYIRKPVDPLWAFTVVDGEPVYNAANSVDFELPEDMLDELVMTICEYMGVNVKRADMVQYSVAKQRKDAATN